MRVGIKCAGGQVLTLIFMILLWACRPSGGENSVIPPATPLLARQVIGFGVIGASYTHVTAEPVPNGVSLGYLRKGAVVEVLERRSVSSGEIQESWVLVNGAYRGWLKEDFIQVYTSKAQAQTAAESMTR